MSKQNLLNKFKAGFSIGDLDYPDELLVNEKRTTNTHLGLDLYDANLFPISYKDSSKKHQNEILSQLGQLKSIKAIRRQGITIDIDGITVLKKKSLRNQ